MVRHFSRAVQSLTCSVMSPRGGGDAVQFEVVADSEGDQKHRWEGDCLASAPLKKLADDWAEAHNVPSHSVGLEDQSGRELDLSKTPSDYGWVGAIQAITLNCFPLHEEFMAPEDALPPASCPNRTHGKMAAPAKRATPEAEVEAPKKRAKAAATGGSSASSQVEASPKQGEPKAPKSKPVEAPKSKPVESKAKAAAPSGAVVPNSGAQPGDDEPILFVQENPKRSGSTSWDRYEAYKKGKTVKEAMQLGAAKGDILHDWKKGFFHRKK
eukprot:TRINITY_DN7649_c0_g1_i1.p1 TRINITY_DN7649_c0_g1~~TRINITY_DN7649_c0_g1_i1.p1  ORF type:complete len:269 (+),score=59.41 TRINITY_DN7649_c0_g1_i1:116-922(+)